MQPEESIPIVTIYSDGGAEPNPGKGGFGVIMTSDQHKKEFYQGYLLTTNNRMELLGVIFALEKLKKISIVNVYTDSQYVINGIEKGWAKKWKSNNWFRTKTERATNYDLWEKLLDLISIQKSVRFHWVKGHAGHTENERCDQLAEYALKGNNLLTDLGYMPQSKNVSVQKQTERVEQNQPKVKVVKEGDSCRNCSTPVVKKQTKKKTIRPNQAYYFEYYLFCPSCRTVYMVEDAKRFGNSRENGMFT